MAQALEKMNVSQNLGKVFSFAQNWFYFSKTVFGEIRFPQKSLINRKMQPLTLSRKKPCATNPNNLLSLLQSPTKRAARKKLKFWRRRRVATGAHISKMKAQYQTFRMRFSSFLCYA